MQRAVGPLDAELQVIFFLAAQRQLDGLLRAGAVLGMHPLAPGLEYAAPLFRFGPVHAVHLRIPNQHIFGNIPIPDPDVGRARGQVQALGQAGGGLLRALLQFALRQPQGGLGLFQ